MDDEKVVGINYGGIHEVHEAWFESVGEVIGFKMPEGNKVSNILKYVLNAREIPDCDKIVCEGHFAVRTALSYKLLHPSTTVIRLIADEGYYNCLEGEKSCIEEKLLHRFLDGGIAVSELAKNWAENFIKGGIKVVHPFVSDLQRLQNVKIAPHEGFNVLFIGYNNPNKNVDLLKEVVREIEGVDLYIVGKGHAESEAENIHVEGFVEDIKPYLAKTDFYVQPSEGDTFPVAVLEAMAAGVPVLVSKSTGTKEILDPLFVTEANKESLQQRIKEIKSTDFDFSKPKKFQKMVNKRKSKGDFCEAIKYF